MGNHFIVWGEFIGDGRFLCTCWNLPQPPRRSILITPLRGLLGGDIGKDASMQKILFFPQQLITFIGGISEWTGKITSYLMLITVAATVIEVVARYFFNAPTDWSYEVETFTCGAVYVLVGAYCSLHKSHVKVDVLSQRFSWRTSRIISLVVTFPLILILVGTLSYIGVEFAWTSILMNERSYTSWAPILWPLKITLPIGCMLLVLQAFADFLAELYAVGGDSQ